MSDESAIPAPFDEVPTIEAPTEEDREHADLFFPPRAIPEEGPIPDYHHVHTVEQDIVVLEWALEAARYRLRFSDPDKVDRFLVQDVLLESAQIYEQFVTPGGRDATEALLNDVRDDDGDGTYAFPEDHMTTQRNEVADGESWTTSGGGENDE